MRISTRLAAVAFATAVLGPVFAETPYVIVENEQWVRIDNRKDIVSGSALDFTSMALQSGPAGKWGWLKAKGGDFEFENLPGVRQRFYGVNLCFGACYPTHAWADRLVARLVRLGYNTVRIHHHDGIWAAQPEMRERLDYLLAKLFENGLYVTTDFYVSRTVAWREIGIDREGDMPCDLFKSRVLVDDTAFENWCAYTREFLEHVNPYTGRAFKDEPAMPFYSLINEGAVLNNWNVAKKTDEKLLVAWRKYVGDETVSEIPSETDAQRWKIRYFGDELDRAFVGKARAFLTSIGFKGLITNDNNGWRHGEGESGTASYDYVDSHVYVDHPSFLGKPWRLPTKCPNVNPIRVKQPGTFRKGWARNATKPYALSEWNFSGPGKFRGLGGVLSAASAVEDGWDALWRFAYAHNLSELGDNPEQAPKTFDCSLDPLMQASDRAAVCIFLRGDADEGTVETDEQAGTLRFASPRSCGVFSEGGRIATGLLAADILDAPATVYVTSLDGQPLKDSSRMMLMHLTDVQSCGAVYSNETRQVLLKRGTGCLVESGRAAISLQVPDPQRCAVFALDTTGTRLFELPTSVEDGVLTFTVETKTAHGGVLYYEIVRRSGRDLFDLVNPFLGTGGDGHCFPAATYPFGLVQAGPDTGWGGWRYCSGYSYEDSHITMFSQTHNAGGGCPDYADIGIMPGVASNAFDHASETARPGYYAVTLKDGNIRAEVTASEHCALYRLDFGKKAEAKLLVDLDYGMANPTWAKKTVQPLVIDRSPADGLSGHLLRSGFVKGRHIGFDIRFSKRPIACEELPPVVREKDVAFRSPRLVYTFDLSDGAPLMVKCGLSTVDGEGAGKNLRQELPDWDFESVCTAAAAKWREQLSRVALDPATDRDTAAVFATCLYRLFHAPSNIADVDGRYRGGDGKVAETVPNGRYYSEFSLWDTFRGAHPFYTLVASEYVADFVNSLVRHGEVTGFLPVLPKWGQDSQCMIATHAVAVIVEAYFKGVGGVDWERAYRVIRQTLRETHPDRKKEGWDLLDKYGYYPCDLLKGEGVSRTLECSYDDWCAARMAAALGYAEDAAFFAKRAENWRNVFDAQTGFMRGRKTDGGWREPFDPYHCGHESSWVGDFTEGNAWQWRWHVLQDPEGLVSALGGKARAAELLDELFALPSNLDASQTSPDVTGLEGQYVQGNEPSHHIPYLYQYAGRPDRAAERIRQLSRKFYRNAPDGLCGNEDHGEMSAWYVYACLGFYPVNPASGEFVLGAPQVPAAQVEVRGGGGQRKTFSVVARGLSETNKYVKSVTLNGKPLDGFILRYADIMKGGELVFEMSDCPNDGER